MVWMRNLARVPVSGAYKLQMKNLFEICIQLARDCFRVLIKRHQTFPLALFDTQVSAERLTRVFTSREVKLNFV